MANRGDGSAPKAIDHLSADEFSPLGTQPVLIVGAREWHHPGLNLQAIVIGVDEAGDLPPIDLRLFDALITTATGAPAPWVSVPKKQLRVHLEALTTTARANPIAASVLARVLRVGESLAIDDALELESLAYSTLLGGTEFARWTAANVAPKPVAVSSPVLVDRDGNVQAIILANPAQRNAMTADMRDALFEALANALDDPTTPQVIISGKGDCFSTGGAIWEFGNALDLAQAHLVRTLHSCARLIDRLGPRCTVRLHGACIGSGIEVSAAAHRRIAAPASWFQLPELAMGLIPGAGGTATIGRAVGRHRAAWMMLSGKRINAETALKWGLIHGIEA